MKERGGVWRSTAGKCASGPSRHNSTSQTHCQTASCTFTGSSVCNVEQHLNIFLRPFYEIWWVDMKTTLFSLWDVFPVLAIKPCYFQLAVTGNEIQAAGLTRGGKISSQSATGQQAASHTCNMLCWTQSLGGLLVFLIGTCRGDVSSTGLCHTDNLSLTCHLSYYHPLIVF